jgi:AcrR family transcriptional regulator
VTTSSNDAASTQRPSPRQRLLAAAGDLFYRQGIGAVGVNLVSKAAGVSKRTMYQQFASKDELIAASLDEAGEAIMRMYLPPGDLLNSKRPAREQILAVFDAQGDWAGAPEFRGCPFINTATELPDPQHPARAVVLRYKLRLRDFFAAEAERGGSADPQQLADQLLILFDGAIMESVLGTVRGPDAAVRAVATLLDAAGVR